MREKVRRLRRLLFQGRFFTYRWRLYTAAEKILPAFHGQVLDIGAGNRPYRPFLPADAVYTALELVPIPGNDVIANVLALPFAPESFDGVICTEVIEHVPEPEHALREMWRVLRPGGSAYITVPMSWALHYVPHDYYRYTRYGLTHLLGKTGFRVERVEQVGGLFTLILARLEDVLGALLFKSLFPLKFVVGPRGRVLVSSLLILVLALPLDVLASGLDRVVPGARQDALGWVAVAVKEERVQ